MREPDELLKLAKSAVKACPAEACEVEVTEANVGEIRWAAGGVTTSGATDRVSVRVRASFGTRSAVAESEDVTPEGIARVARRAADLAKITPASPEFMGPVKPQSYPRSHPWDAATAASSPESRAAKAAASLAVAKDAGLVSAGYFQDQATVIAVANSLGNAGTWRGTTSDFSNTLRTNDGKQSGWAGFSAVRAADVDARALAKRAAEKATTWRDPIELPPGRYTAVLEPAAAAPLVEYVFGALDRRSADEGTSCFARKEKTAVGESLFADGLSLVSDPADKRIPGVPWGESQLAAQKLTAIDHGKLETLDTGRWWAKQHKLPATPNAGNWSFAFEEPAKDLDALIAGCEKGVLVTRIWYVRMLAPQTLTVTGLTRDATFLIEDGRVTSPIKNFRLNQSVLDLLKNVEAAGPTELVDGYGVPALRVKEFGFSSISDAV